MVRKHQPLFSAGFSDPVQGFGKSVDRLLILQNLHPDPDELHPQCIRKGNQLLHHLCLRRMEGNRLQIQFLQQRFQFLRRDLKIRPEQLRPVISHFRRAPEVLPAVIHRPIHKGIHLQIYFSHLFGPPAIIDSFLRFCSLIWPLS